MELRNWNIVVKAFILVAIIKYLNKIIWSLISFSNSTRVKKTIRYKKCCLNPNIIDHNVLPFKKVIIPTKIVPYNKNIIENIIVELYLINEPFVYTCFIKLIINKG